MSEKWLINESPDTDNDMEITINFTSATLPFTRFGIHLNAIEYYSQGTFELVYGKSWIDEAYRTVEFETAPTGDLLTWLEQNAVKQQKPITDLTGYTWVGNETLGLEFFDGEFLNFYFINNGVAYNMFAGLSSEAIPDIEFPDGYDYCLFYFNDNDLLPVYFFNGETYAGYWTNEAYKTIQITGGDDATDTDFIVRLEQNGTLTAPHHSEPITLAIGVGGKSLIHNGKVIMPKKN